jgi:hypothetical protein
MDVHHGLDGGRRVSVERADHSRIYAERGRRGYVERRYSYRGHDYARRSYYWHGHEYNRYYRGYYYHGAYVHAYAPGYYYAPAFYGWAYNPWYTPVPYAWGWAGNPWYASYGYYFAPYPVYAAPAFWLTDYLIAAQLTAAYAAQQEANQQAANAATGQVVTKAEITARIANEVVDQIAGPAFWPADALISSELEAAYAALHHADPPAADATAGQPAMTPEIKAQVADEVKNQIALENAEAQQNAAGQDIDPASSGIARMMSDGKSHVFVAGDALDVVDANGTECALSEGDVLQLTTPPAANATDASLTVLSSKGRGKECQRAATVTVAVADLQEMQNHMRETVDQGLQELQSKQGQGGLPAAPASAKAPPVETAMAQNAPPPEQNGASEINEQLADADKVDQDAASQTATGSNESATGAPAPPQSTPQATQTITITPGQTIEQVTAALGQPVSIFNGGAKTIYKYKDMKVTFKDGKVTDVE